MSLLALLAVGVAEGCIAPLTDVEAIQPADGALGVATDTHVRLAFPDDSWFLEPQPRLVGPDGAVVGLTALDAPPNIRAYAPDSGLLPDTAYTVEDPAYGAWTFTTGAEPAAPVAGRPSLDLFQVEQRNGGRAWHCEGEGRRGVVFAEVFPAPDPTGLTSVSLFVADDDGEPVGEPVAGGLVTDEQPLTIVSIWSLSERLPRETCFVVVQENAAGEPTEPSDPVCGRPVRTSSCATAPPRPLPAALLLAAFAIRRRR